MSCMLYNCSLITLPDISKWDTSNATYMIGIFSNCYLSKSLPDISKWDTQNIINMEYILYSYKSLISLADISR